MDRQVSEFLARLASVRDPQSRLALAVERARKRPPLPDNLRADGHRVEGCQVRLWFVPELKNGSCWFHTDSDAVTLKALVGLLCDFYSGRTPSEILAQPPVFLEDLGLLHHLAESRRATILRVIEKIRQFASDHVQNRTPHKTKDFGE